MQTTLAVLGQRRRYAKDTLETQMTNHEGSFQATDNNGNEYTIHMFRDRIDTTTMRSGVRTLAPAALGELKTEDGRHVNRIDKGSYEIVDFSMIPLTSDDPKAP